MPYIQLRRAEDDTLSNHIEGWRLQHGRKKSGKTKANEVEQVDGIVGGADDGISSREPSLSKYSLDRVEEIHDVLKSLSEITNGKLDIFTSWKNEPDAVLPKWDICTPVKDMFDHDSYKEPRFIQGKLRPLEALIDRLRHEESMMDADSMSFSAVSGENDEEHSLKQEAAETEDQQEGQNESEEDRMEHGESSMCKSVPPFIDHIVPGKGVEVI